jgi:Holliday junction resolvase-like predicted endonuclease
MVVELNLLISLLKLTGTGSVLIESVNRDARLPSDVTEKLLQNLQNQELVYLKGGIVEADTCSRLKLAVKAVSLGADVEQVSSLLCWQEFEEIAAFTLRNNSYVVAKNVRFKHGGRKWEIDVVGCRKPLVVCVDCKHYHHGMSPSAMQKIAEAQVQRTKALADSLPNVTMKLNCASWDKAKFVPAILSLLPSRVKFFDDVPIVPVLQLQDFISQLPVQVESLTYFRKEFSHLRHDF